MRNIIVTAIIVGAIARSSGAEPLPQPLRAVPLEQVEIRDVFWAPRLETTRTVSIPYIFEQCEKTHRLANFDQAAKGATGTHEGYFFNDSDVYKAIEAAALALATRPDPELDARVDAIIQRIAAAQQPDGYLNTYFTLTPQEKPWSNVRVRHELYCAGHLIEAGIAHRRATGKTTLFDVAVRFADLIDRTFGPDKRRDVPGHQEIELALIKLADVTGEERYRRLAHFFIEQRGKAEGRQLYGEYCQDHLPVAGQSRIVGHAVRATYLYCAMADLARQAGLAQTPAYLAALDRLWHDATQRNMYVTGGLGVSSKNEGFTTSYDLPNESAYAETCAGIGLVFWAQRMNLLYADARYIDVLERALYNGVLSGISLDGKMFAYTNPLAHRGPRHRRPWFECACCPPNIARLFMSLGEYGYAVGEDGIYVNLYVASDARVPRPGGDVGLHVQTAYPWEGQVELTVDPAPKGPLSLYLRIPEWCSGASLRVNSEALPSLEIERGYVRLHREWRAGDRVALDLPMPVQRVASHPRVAADVGKIALQRGPLVYCVEGADTEASVHHLALPRTAEITTEHVKDLLGGVTVLRTTGALLSTEAASKALYRTAEAPTSASFTAIPFYAWDNREPGDMLVWLPETTLLAEQPPDRSIRAAASHCYRGDTLTALADGVEPKSSDDATIPRFTWWDRKGSTEWVEYTLDPARTVGEVAVYWFDDSEAGGQCRAPESWKLFYRDGGEWKEIPDASPGGVELNRYNTVTFTPVRTTGLRIEAKLRQGFSGGILEWSIDGD